MDQSEAIKAALALYEEGKAKSQSRRYTLKDITDEEFSILGKEDKSQSEEGIDSTASWYNQRFRQFKEMLKAFDVLDEFNGLRPKGHVNTFTERNKNFILMLFREYSGKFENLKRGKVNTTDGAYLLEVYTGILDIFYDADAPEFIIEGVMLKLWNRLNIPQRNMDATIESVCDQCKKMVRKNVTSVSMGMGVREKIFWQSAFRQAFYDLIYRWDRFYEIMEDIRKDEVLDKARLQASSASPEWTEYAEIEFALSDEISKAFENDPEIQRLSAERDKILGLDKKRPPLVRKIEKPFEECTSKLAKRMQEVKLEIIRNHIPDYQPPEGCDELPYVDYNFMPLHQLLDEAIKDEQQQREWCPIGSINDLLGRMQKYFP